MSTPRPTLPALRALVLSPSPSDDVRRLLERTPRVDVTPRDRLGVREALRHGREKSHDVVIAVPARRFLAGATMLKHAGWRVVVVAGAREVLPGPWRRLADATFAGEGFDEAGADRLAAVASAAAGVPGAGLTQGPRVSVVATVLDEEAGIEQLVARVAAQLGEADELVVVDGGSTDATLRLLRQAIRGDARVRLVSAPGTNIAAGRNAGIREARHGVIVTTDADCLLSPSWLESLRMPFGERERPGLVAGNCAVVAHGPLERAQALACYPDPEESRHPTLVTRLYGRAFGTVLRPEVPFARSLAFSREAWDAVGGFPERLRWTEDAVFGRKVARHFDCVLAVDAVASWEQRGSWRSTFAMYVNYGRGAAASEESRLVANDLLRGAAYLGSVLALGSGRRRATPAVVAGASLYLSVPVLRALRHRAGVRTVLCLPLALATKDLGKMAGAFSTRAGSLGRRASVV